MRAPAVVLLGLILACGKSKQPAPASGSAVESGSGATPDRGPAVSVALPEVAGHGYEVNAPAARVTATPTAIIVDGKQVLALENGVVPTAAVTDGQIAAVAAGLSAPSREPRMVLALDKQVSYALLLQVMLTLKTQGVRSFGILARANGQPVMLPLDLPDKARPSVQEPPMGRSSPSAGLEAALRGEETTVEVADASVSPDASLNGAGVKIKISATYIPMLKRCAAKAAGRSSTPKDAFELSFTIDETGRAIEPSVRGTLTEVADCITGAMSSWRFPIPKDSDMAGIRVTARVTLAVRYPEGGSEPSASDGASGPPPSMVPDEQPLGIVVAITKTDVIVFSISALEGTLREPRLSLPLTSPDGPQKVSRLLEDIAKRRWGGKAKRAEHDLDIVVMADPATPMQKVAEVFGAVRASPNGTELFPRVRLSAGFE